MVMKSIVIMTTKLVDQILLKSWLVVSLPLVTDAFTQYMSHINLAIIYMENVCKILFDYKISNSYKILNQYQSNTFKC